MCNYSDAIERLGEQKGRREGREEGRQEGRREGRQEGRREGREEGRREGVEMLGTLIAKLLELGRNEDVKKVAMDSEYREALFSEFGLVSAQ